VTYVTCIEHVHLLGARPHSVNGDRQCVSDAACADAVNRMNGAMSLIGTSQPSIDVR
jgi:hypothetical protein